MRPNRDRERLEWTLAARTFAGTRAEVLAQLDVFIDSLVGCRLWIAGGGSPEQGPRGPESRGWPSAGVISFCVAVLGLAATAWAQPAAQEAPKTPPPDPPALTVALGLETYYQYNWNRPFDGVTLLRAYDTRDNSFSLQQASLIFESAPDVAAGRRFGGRLDLQFGQATETAQGNPANEPRPDVYRHIWQAYGTYVFPVGRGLTVDVGKFASNLGYETNYAKDNNQFSRAYLFNFLPFYHTGARLTLPVSDTVTVMYALTNGVQQTEDVNDFKSHHVTAIVKPRPWITWTASFYQGREQAATDGRFRVLDSYVSLSLGPAVSLGADVNYTTSQVHESDPTTSLQGTSLYARWQASAPLALSARFERLDDEGLFAGLEQHLHSLTATVEHLLADGFLLRGEWRRDWSDRDFFTTSTSDRRRHQHTATVGAVWWFGSKAGTW